MKPTDDLVHAMRGAVALTACVVQTLAESDPDFRARFLKKVEDAYQDFRDYQRMDDGSSNLNELSMLAWVRKLLKDKS
ncbi:MAG: hypothetical protein KGZ73_03060 [Rhizobiales bacterium]|nr:hypothetical protein [Hyphomicrobiales bacterium]